MATSREVVVDAGAGLAARLYIPSDVLGTPEKLPLLVYFHGGAFAVHSSFSGAHSRFLTSERARGGGPRGGRVRGLPPRAFINPLVLPAEEWARLGCRRALVTVAELDTMRDRGRRYIPSNVPRRRWRPSCRSSSKVVGSICVVRQAKGFVLGPCMYISISPKCCGELNNDYTPNWN